MAQAPAYPRLLQTARLALTPIGAADAEELHELWSPPAVSLPLWRGWALSLEQTREIAARSAWLHAERGLGLWGARGDGDAPLIGVGGFWFLQEPGEPELLYAMRPGHWGRGFATELAHALVAYAWSVLQLAEIRATTESDNVASVALLRRLGFAPVARASARDGRSVFRLVPLTVDESWGT
jgi:ribosomal-protein-alanine N-acetyltransferase